jgi:hypothetical protein
MSGLGRKTTWCLKKKKRGKATKKPKPSPIGALKPQQISAKTSD